MRNDVCGPAYGRARDENRLVRDIDGPIREHAITRCERLVVKVDGSEQLQRKVIPVNSFAMKEMLGLARNTMKQTHDSSNWEVLSVREREVMLLAAKGLPNKEIARELKVTEGTIKLHLHSVYRKLGVKGRFALAVRVKNRLMNRQIETNSAKRQV